MKEFKEKLKINTIITAIACVILAVTAVVTFDAKLGIVPFVDFSADGSWRAFLSGASTGMLLVYVCELIRNILALRNDEKLKKMFVKDNDERDKQIWSYARSTASRTTLLLGVVVGIVVGCFDRMIGLTIIACLVAHSLLVLAFVFYYKKKF